MALPTTPNTNRQLPAGMQPAQTFRTTISDAEAPQSTKYKQTAGTNWESFMLAVVASKLVEAETIRSFYEQLRSRPEHGFTAASLAQRMVKLNVLTGWQAARLLKGQTDGFFLGAYKLRAPLGRGGMGVVYLAEHTRMRRLVAIKVLLDEFVADKSRLDLLYRESRVTAALDHPNIVRAFDVDCHEGTHYLVMEYVQGESLQQHVERQGPLFFEDAVEYLRQAADALAHAHQRGIVHRDIKPANLMLTSQGVVKMLDMGLAHGLAGSAVAETEQSVAGTADYMAPEQAIDAKTADPRSDLYSLGCTLWFMLTGTKPFPGKTLWEILMHHQMTEPQDLGQKRRGVPAELERICRRLMAKEPELRFQSAVELRDRLAQWLTDRSTLVAAQAAAGPTDHKAKILVADDDPVTRKSLDWCLRRAGYEVVLAVDGGEAIRLLDDSIDACLFDLQMPAASGFDCLRHVQQQFPQTPVVIISGTGEVQDAVSAMREGAFDYITKPLCFAGVLSRIDEALRHPGPPSERPSGEDLL